MELLNTSSITNFPEHVILGYTEIRPDLSDELLSEDEQKSGMVSPISKEKNEYLSARHLFKEMLSVSGLNSDHEIFKHPLGKPYAQNENEKIFVSFSHSKNMFFVRFLNRWILV